MGDLTFEIDVGALPTIRDCIRTNLGRGWARSA